MRLALAGMLALVTAAALPDTLRPVTRLLAGWNVGVSVYLALAFYVMAASSVDVIRKRAAQQDQGRFGILCLTAAAAIASLGAIFIEIGKVEGGPPPQASNFMLGVTTIVLSWLLIQTMFALHYAHEFYFAGGGDKGGLDFPGEGELDADYWDFFYFAVTIGLTSQTSDVAIKSRTMRRTVTAHIILAFIFNAAIVALTVNIAASAI